MEELKDEERGSDATPEGHSKGGLRVFEQAGRFPWCSAVFHGVSLRVLWWHHAKRRSTPGSCSRGRAGVGASKATNSHKANR